MENRFAFTPRGRSPYEASILRLEQIADNAIREQRESLEAFASQIPEEDRPFWEIVSLQGYDRKMFKRVGTELSEADIEYLMSPLIKF